MKLQNSGGVAIVVSTFVNWGEGENKLADSGRILVELNNFRRRWLWLCFLDRLWQNVP